MYRIQQNTEQIYNSSNNNSGIDQSKQQLINYIYDRCNLFNFKYDSLEVESELPQLISKTFYVSANFSGSSCLLVFAKIKDRYHQILVDRKTLSYNVKKVDIKNVKMIPVKINLDVDIYQGTIFDGTFVQTKNERTFIITDVYLFKGQDLTRSHLDSKLLTVRTYLESNYKEDKNNDLTVTVNMLFPLDKTRHLIENVIPKIKHFLIRGICFYPEVSGTKLLYKFGNENVSSQNNQSVQNNQYNQSNQYNQYNQLNQSNQYKQNNNHNHLHKNKQNYQTESNPSNPSNPNNDPELDSEELTSSPKKEYTKISETPKTSKVSKTSYGPKEGKNDESYVFEMKKTDSIDVYTLNVVEEVIKDSKVFLKRKQIGLAYVPNMSRSKWCKEIIEQSDGNILVNCKYHPNKEKWEPILISTSKRPSYVSELQLLKK